MIQLEYNPPRGRNEHLIRIEWRPLAPHTNNNKAPERYRLMIICTSHIHRFEHNYFEAGSRMVRGNLPHAIPLEPDPSDFGDLLEVAAKELMISDLSRVATPPWQARMV
jgi:hypothetical protein